MNNNKKQTKIILAVATFIVSYTILTFVFGMNEIAGSSGSSMSFIMLLPQHFFIKTALSLLFSFMATLLIRDSLDIKSTTVGDGQYGSSSWLPENEKKKVYKHIKQGQEQEAGFLVGVDGKDWVIDTSDNNLLLLAPPGGGKTTTVYVPTIVYNGNVQKNTGKGASMLITDLKGELFRVTAPYLESCGYETVVLNFREIFKGKQFNIMYKVNNAMDKYLQAATEKERALYYGEAERYAKIVANSIVDNMSKGSSSSASDYFDESAKGLITGLILYVAETPIKAQRHIISVFNIVLELSKDQELHKTIKSKRVQNYVGATFSADVRTMMNVLSSAISKLTKFIDAEMEQMICNHSPELEAFEFAEKPTAVYLICPDENTTRHFFASLYIRFLANDLIEITESKYDGVLPRPVLFLIDEFGNMPSIQDVDVIFSAIRSRGVRILIALQSYAQLNKNYSKERAEIIKDTCQMIMFTFVSPSSQSTAESISKMLGNETVMSGSVSYSDMNKVSVTNNMVGKPLLSVAEIVTTPWGTWYIMKGGYKPSKTTLTRYSNIVDLERADLTAIKEYEYSEVQLFDIHKAQLIQSVPNTFIKKGMFDD